MLAPTSESEEGSPQGRKLDLAWPRQRGRAWTGWAGREDNAIFEAKADGLSILALDASSGCKKFMPPDYWQRARAPECQAIGSLPPPDYAPVGRHPPQDCMKAGHQKKIV